MQIAAPGTLEQIVRSRKTGWGLKPATKKTFGWDDARLQQTAGREGRPFFDEIDASTKEGQSYCGRGFDYGLQQYLYWKTIIEQIPGYDKWLHEYEMPFMRVIGFDGVSWDAVER